MRARSVARTEIVTAGGRQIVSRSLTKAESLSLGIRQNWRQFSLLVLVNAFVGAMVGLERTVLPLIAADEFGIASKSAVLAFVASFGVAKSLSNVAAGWLMDRQSRRWTLIAGWLIALPVPLVIWLAPSWSWIVAANALLGINQGFAWSATVIMKMDLAGPTRRGLAMGLNEFAGYLAVAIAAFASGVIAARFGLRAGPVYLGVVIAIAGLVTSVVFVRDTTAHARLEAVYLERKTRGSDAPAIRRVLVRSLWSDASLFSASQAGFVNNLNDGLAWGLLPLFFIGAGVTLEATGALAAIYPAVWGTSQILTGGLSDRFGRKPLIVAGMVVQGMALLSIAVWQGIGAWTAALVALGAGTALVYPTLLAAVADSAGPSARAPAVAVYRLWRDLGYVAGALLAGALADAIGIPAAIEIVGALTIASGTVVALRLVRRPVPGRETLGVVVQKPSTGAP